MAAHPAWERLGRDVGMTDKVAIGHYLKRILAIDAMFGDSDFHFRKVGAR